MRSVKVKEQDMARRHWKVQGDYALPAKRMCGNIEGKFRHSYSLSGAEQAEKEKHWMWAIGLPFTYSKRYGGCKRLYYCAECDEFFYRGDVVFSLTEKGWKWERLR